MGAGTVAPSFTAAPLKPSSGPGAQRFAEPNTGKQLGQQLRGRRATDSLGSGQGSLVSEWGWDGPGGRGGGLSGWLLLLLAPTLLFLPSFPVDSPPLHILRAGGMSDGAGGRGLSQKTHGLAARRAGLAWPCLSAGGPGQGTDFLWASVTC